MRPATSDDKAFARSVQNEGIRPYHEVYFGWDEARAIAEFDREWPARPATVIESSGERVGWFSLAQRPQYWALNRFHVAKAFRGCGVGAQTLRLLTARAGYHGAPIILQVYKNNPARRLYDRFAFFIEREDAVHYHMRREAPGSGLPAAWP
ncbi:MAG: GNAT family N-acetyltransferase [Pseudomonadota bacterium]